METEDIASSKSANSENGSAGSFNVSLSSGSETQKPRSKSLPYIYFEGYTPAELRKIRERLLRYSRFMDQTGFYSAVIIFRTNTHLEPSAIKRFTRNQKLTLASLALVDFISFCSMSIMAPFFPKEASEKQMSNTLSGLVFSFYALVMFLTSPVFGKIVISGLSGFYLVSKRSFAVA